MRLVKLGNFQPQITGELWFVDKEMTRYAVHGAVTPLSIIRLNDNTQVPIQLNTPLLSCTLRSDPDPGDSLGVSTFTFPHLWKRGYCVYTAFTHVIFHLSTVVSAKMPTALKLLSPEYCLQRPKVRESSLTTLLFQSSIQTSVSRLSANFLPLNPIY